MCKGFAALTLDMASCAPLCAPSLRVNQMGADFAGVSSCP